MTQIYADDIMRVIQSHGWWQSTDADSNPKDRACLAMALAGVVRDRLGLGLVPRDLHECAEWARWDAALRATARELFPGRVDNKQFPYISFNDHPDTTLADVELVVKEAERRL